MTRQALQAAVSVYPVAGRILSFTMDQETTDLLPERVQPEDDEDSGTILFVASPDGVPLKGIGGDRRMLRIPAPSWIVGKYRDYEPVAFDVDIRGLRIVIPSSWRDPK